MSELKKDPFLDYRSPYVWQSRALNFNRQLISKLNHIQKYNSRQVPQRIKKIGIPHQHRNGNFQHRLLEVSASSTSSISPSISSREEGEDLCPNKYFQMNNNHANQLVRNNMEYSSPKDRGTAPFLPHGNRCPVHSLPQMHSSPHKPHPIHPLQEGHRFPPLPGDMVDYGYRPTHYLSRPYGYRFFPESQYLAPYPPYYSSHMYLPGSYLSMPYLSSNPYPKHLSLPAYQPHRNHSMDAHNSMRLYSEPPSSGSGSKGKIIVLAIILTVITIGVVMGILLAVSIN